MTCNIPRIRATGYIDIDTVINKVPMTVEGVQPVKNNKIKSCEFVTYGIIAP